MPTELKPRKDDGKSPQFKTFDLEHDKITGKSLLLTRLSWSPIGGIATRLVQHQVVSTPLYWIYVASVILLATSLSLYTQVLLFSSTLTGLWFVLYVIAGYFITRAVADRLTHRPMSERSAKLILASNPAIMVVDPELDSESDVLEKSSDGSDDSGNGYGN